MTPGCEVSLYTSIPGLNEILAAKGNSFRHKGANRSSAYTVMKKKYTSFIVSALKAQHCIPEVPYDMIVPHIICYEVAKRRDLDNIAAGVFKFGLDALVEAEVILNDNLMHIRAMSAEYAPRTNGHRYARLSWTVI